MQPVSGDGKFAMFAMPHGTNKIGIASNHDIQQGLELPQVSNTPLGCCYFTQCSILAFWSFLGLWPRLRREGVGKGIAGYSAKCQPLDRIALDGPSRVLVGKLSPVSPVSPPPK